MSFTDFLSKKGLGSPDMTPLERFDLDVAEARKMLASGRSQAWLVAVEATPEGGDNAERGAWAHGFRGRFMEVLMGFQAILARKGQF